MAMPAQRVLAALLGTTEDGRRVYGGNCHRPGGGPGSRAEASGAVRPDQEGYRLPAALLGTTEDGKRVYGSSECYYVWTGMRTLAALLGTAEDGKRVYGGYCCRQGSGSAGSRGSRRSSGLGSSRSGSGSRGSGLSGSASGPGSGSALQSGSGAGSGYGSPYGASGSGSGGSSGGESGNGSSSGSGTPEEPPIQTDCCPAPIPAVLYAMVDSGPCAGTYRLDWDGSAWSNLDVGGCEKIVVYCLFVFFSPQWNVDTFASSNPAASVDCSPFHLVANGVVFGTCCDSTVTITVTE